MTSLQIALDLLSIPDALAVSEASVKGGARWLEVGTPLIKNHGAAAIRKLRGTFPEATIVADMKTMDTGDLEVEIAAKNGADVVSILGLASDYTIKRAVTQAKAHDVRIMADLIGIDDKIGRAEELESLGVDYILLHAPLDVQKVKEERVDASLELLKELVEAVDIPVAVAGGITEESIGFLKDAGAEIFVVGRTVTKARDVEGTVSRLCKIVGAEVREEKASAFQEEDIIKGFMELPTPFVSDAQKRFGAMRGLKPLIEGKRIAGRTFTVKTLGGDWGKVVKAVDAAREGDIIVVDAQGVEIAVWGELATRSAMKKGIRGIIIDGAVRDSDDIKGLGFPVWARYITPNAGEPHGHGRLNERVSCGGQPVEPGDIIVADEVGVVVVPSDRGEEILKKSLEIKRKEGLYKEEIEKGRTLSEIFGL